MVLGHQENAKILDPSLTLFLFRELLIHCNKHLKVAIEFYSDDFNALNKNYHGMYFTLYFTTISYFDQNFSTNGLEICNTNIISVNGYIRNHFHNVYEVRPVIGKKKKKKLE